MVRGVFYWYEIPKAFLILKALPWLTLHRFYKNR